MSLNVESKAYLNVYRVMEDISFENAVPAGSRGLIYSAIDGLRRASAPVEHIHLVECISLTLHKLERAIRDRSDDDIAQLRSELKVAGATWLQTPLRLSMQ